jgi:hypothetical protein
MKTIKVITEHGKQYLIGKTILSTNSNHNTFVHVIDKANKSPLCGTSFNDNTTDDKLIEWGIRTLNEYLYKPQTLFL